MALDDDVLFAAAYLHDIAAFAQAERLIEPSLVPFEAWSLLDSGLFGDEGGSPRIGIIDTTEKGESLLRLFDATIGTAEGAVSPYDLPAALQQVARIAPNGLSKPAYRRLAALARR